MRAASGSTLSRRPPLKAPMLRLAMPPDDLATARRRLELTWIGAIDDRSHVDGRRQGAECLASLLAEASHAECVSNEVWSIADQGRRLHGHRHALGEITRTKLGHMLVIDKRATFIDRRIEPGILAANPFQLGKEHFAGKRLLAKRPE